MLLPKLIQRAKPSEETEDRLYSNIQEMILRIIHNLSK